MGKNTGIQWCDSTFNPWIGCTKVSPGCTHCYAETLDRRTLWDNQTHWGPSAPRLRTSESNWRQPITWNKQGWLECVECGWRGPYTKATSAPTWLCPECEGKVRTTRQRVFCASLADVFEDNDQLIDWRLDLFRMIEKTPSLDWLILTKRIDIAAHFFRLLKSMPPNMWLGTSVENQAMADRRIEELVSVPATVKFLSIEPLLEPVNLNPWLIRWPVNDKGQVYRPFDWVIIGGESGPKARPFNVAWARDIIRQCRGTGIPVFVKQLGAKPFIDATPQPSLWPVNTYTESDGRNYWLKLKSGKGGNPSEWAEDLQIREMPEIRQERIE